MPALNVNKAEFIKSAAQPKQFINSSIYTVKMSFGIWTCIRITDSFLTETDLFFCRQRQYFIAKPFAF